MRDGICPLDSMSLYYQTMDYESQVLSSIFLLSLGAERCWDANTWCPRWAALGDCQGNSDYMDQFCRKSCGLCGKSPPLGVRSFCLWDGDIICKSAIWFRIFIYKVTGLWGII